MARVKIKFPIEKPLIIVSIPIRIGDINYGGHLGNDSILSIMHESRMQLLHQCGFDEMNAGGVSLIMADVMIAYRGEGFYGDVLNVSIYAEEIGGHSFDLLYKIEAFRDGKKVDIAHAKTGMVCFDYSIRKVAVMTVGLKKCLQSVAF